MEEPPLYQIVDWNEHFENNKSRERGKCSFVCVPNNHGGIGLGNILSELDGLAIYGAWMLVVQVCSRQKKREGWLTTDGTRNGPRISAAAFARAFKCDVSAILRMLQVVSYPDIGWLRLVEGKPEKDVRALSAHEDGHLVPAETGTKCPSPQTPDSEQDDGGHLVPAETGTKCPERKKEGREIEGDRKAVPTTTVLISQNCEKEEGIQYAEAKAWINNLFQNNMPWSYEEDHLLSELVPIPADVQRLLDWAHRLPPDHPIHEMTMLRQKRVSFLRDFGGEADKVRAMRRQMGYNGHL